MWIISKQFKYLDEFFTKQVRWASAWVGLDFFLVYILSPSYDYVIDTARTYVNQVYKSAELII